MTFVETEPVRTKICIYNKAIEWSTTLRIIYERKVREDVSYNQYRDIENKLHKYQSICGTIQRSWERHKQDGQLPNREIYGWKIDGDGTGKIVNHHELKIMTKKSSMFSS